MIVVNGTPTFAAFGEMLLAELALAPVALRDDTRLVEDLGFDSVLVFELLLVLEEWIGVLLPEALVGQLVTMGDVYEVFRSRSAR